MGIMDMFSGKNSAAPSNNAAPNNQQQNNPQPNPNDPNNMSDPNKTVDPTTGKMPGSGPTNENPLDYYAKIFDNANKANATPNTAPTFNLDPKIVGEVAGKLDFTQGVNPDLLSKAQQGDTAALLTLINEVGRNAYRASLEHGSKLTDAFVGSRFNFENDNLGSQVKKHLTSEAVSSNLDVKHPIIKAELNRIASQFASAPEFADASPQQIAEAAKKYLNDMFAAMNPKTSEDPTNAATGETDWSKFLG